MDKQTRRGVNLRLIYIFRWALIAPTLIWLVICIIGFVIPPFMNLVDYDTGENREKSDFPTELSGDYFAEIESFYNDRVPFRSLFLSANKGLSAMLEKPYENGIKQDLLAWAYGETTGTESKPAESSMNFDDLFGGETTTAPAESSTQKATEKTTENKESELEKTSEYSSESLTEGSSEETTRETVATTESEEAVSTEAPTEKQEIPTAPDGEIDTSSYFPAVVKNDAVIIGRGDWLFLCKGKNLDYYLGTNLLSYDDMNRYLFALSALNDACTAVGKKLSIVIAPNKEQVYSEYMPSYEISNTYKRTQQLVEYVAANSNVPICYPLEEIKAVKSFYRAYFKYDTHWNNIGAFIGLQMMLRQLGMETTNLLNLQIESEAYTYGDLVGLGGLSKDDYCNDVTYNISFRTDISILSVTDSTQANTEYDIYYATSDSPNEKKIVVVGDSYRGAMLKYIDRLFNSVTAFHFKMVQDPVAVEAIRNADVISIVLVERDDVELINLAEYITSVIK